jgi:hypothetical protein
MTKHKYWGEVEQDWSGFSSDITFSNAFFNEPDVTIFLGEECDDDGEEIDIPPTEALLNEMADTYQTFLENIETMMHDLKEKAFERYQELYARFYENSEKSGEPVLNIDNAEKHNKYIKEIIYLRILSEKTIKISIHYQLDTEHGLEFKFVNGQITDVGGIAET